MILDDFEIFTVGEGKRSVCLHASGRGYPQTWIINDRMGPIKWRRAKICWPSFDHAWLFGRRGVLIANN